MAELKRTLGLTECTLMGVGVILGAGIYALVGQAALLAGNAVWLSFLFASLVATSTGLSWEQLGASAAPLADVAAVALGHQAFLGLSVIAVAVVVLRYREPDTPRPFQVPGRVGKLPLIPVFGILSSLFMLSYVGPTAMLLGLGLALVGCVLYFLGFSAQRDGG